jgi:hypothetical protein
LTALELAAVETSKRSVIPAGGVAVPDPLLPKNPSTRASGALVVTEGAAIEAVFMPKWPPWTSTGAAVSVPP